MRHRSNLIVAALLLVPALVHALTLSDLRTRLRRNLRDTDTNASTQRYSDATLNSALNDAQREINVDVSLVENTTFYTLTAGTTYYNVPTDYLGSVRATFTDKNGHTIQLLMYSEKNILDTMPDYEKSASGSPTRFFERQSKTGGTVQQIAFIPTPTTTSTGTVRVDYQSQVTDLANDTDVPFNGYNGLKGYHEIIVYGATAKLKAVEGKTEEAAYYMQLYTLGEQRLKGDDMFPGFKPSASVGGGR